MTAPTDLSHLRDLPDATLTRSEVRILCDEVDRLRDVLVDIAASVPAAHRNDGRDVPERIRDGAAAEAEVGRLRAENAALAAALEDIAGMWQRPDGAWVAMAECSHLTAFTCIEKHPDDPGEWCPTCVAEVAWCARKMGVLT